MKSTPAMERGSNVTSCSADRSGGVVYAVSSEPLSIAGVDFIDNRADGSGSVLYLLNTPSSISDASFTGNTVGDDNDGATIQTDKPIDWDCRLGSWMPRKGSFFGDFSAPECNLCPAGHYGNRSGLTNSSCEGAASAESCLPCSP